MRRIRAVCLKFSKSVLKERYVFRRTCIEEARKKRLQIWTKTAKVINWQWLIWWNQSILEEGYPNRISVSRCEEREIHHKRCIIFLDTCRLVCHGTKTDPLLTDIRNKYGMEYPKILGLTGNWILQIKKWRKSHRSFSDVKI
jgi:hypothetical protein